MPGRFEVGALAVIRRGDQVLVMRRAPDHPHGDGGRWELPSGRLEAGEGFEEGLVREVAEETGLEVADLAPIGTWSLPDRGLVGVAFACEYVAGEVRLSAEHTAYRWLSVDEAMDVLRGEPTAGHLRRYLKWAQHEHT